MNLEELSQKYKELDIQEKAIKSQKEMIRFNIETLAEINNFQNKYISYTFVPAKTETKINYEKICNSKIDALELAELSANSEYQTITTKKGYTHIICTKG